MKRMDGDGREAEEWKGEGGGESGGGVFPTAIKSSQGATGIKDDFTD